MKDHLAKDYLAKVFSAPDYLVKVCPMEYPKQGRMPGRMDRRLAEKAADPKLVDRRCLQSWAWGRSDLGQARRRGGRWHEILSSSE